MIKILIVSVIVLLQSGIHTFSVTGATGGTINFSDFAGKKILIVNIATGSPRAEQLVDLQQLHERYGNSLVIIGFPSNSFGNESRTGSAIQEYCQLQYGVSFLLAGKGSVKGEDIQPLYDWITRKTENGVFDGAVQGDFQKYLFDSDGTPIGIFAGYVSPKSPQLINAITANQN